ncbi:MAG TPA: hypothetical protein DDX54_00310 [Rhodospirillaceae bacterium]|nr:hypothetical protein [Alphaproteobacteria bacterium]HBH25837.1 hypothetical protein [Rhodospirillaceae bacterium]
MRLGLFLILLLLPLPTLAGDREPTPDDLKWGHWMMAYHARKDVGSVPDFLAYLDQGTIWEWEKNDDSAHDATITPRPGYTSCRYAMVMGFLAPIFAQNPDKVGGWLIDVLSEDTKRAAALALVAAGIEDKAPPSYAALMAEAKADAPSLDVPALRACDLDMYWGATFASGDARYVDRILDVLDPASPRTGNDLYDMVMRRSAQWSLGSNMRYAVVERAVAQRREAATGDLRRALDEVWAAYEKNKAAARLPVHDGDFSALLAIVDAREIAKAVEAPSYAGLGIRPLKTARRGDVVTAHLITSGMGLDDRFSADVTYSVRLLYPDGRVYGEFKDIEATRGGPIVRRFDAWSARGHLDIEFVPDDPLGTYTAEVIVRDNVSGKALTLTNAIDLVE